MADSKLAAAMAASDLKHGYTQDQVKRGQAILDQDTNDKSIGVVVQEFFKFLKDERIAFIVHMVHSCLIICHPKNSGRKFDL